MTETLGEWQQKRLGRFTASSIYKLFVSPKTKADKEAGEFSETARSYIFEVAVQEYTGFRKEISSPAMTHGLVNETEAFEVFCRHIGKPFELTSSQFFEYGAHSGASPDALLFDGIDVVAVADMKCPYNPIQFFEQKLELKGQPLPKPYYYQLMLQMMSTGAREAYLVRYLTSTYTDEFGNKFEFELDESERIFWSQLYADEKVFADINDKLNKAVELKNQFIESFKN